MSADGPPLLRPVPRRPFEINHNSPTPPDEDSIPPSPNPAADLSSRLLDPQFAASFGGLSAGGDDDSLGRSQSVMNLTRPTLSGIYSPTASGADRWGEYNDGVEPDTPWGTGSQTPLRREGLDESTYELMRERSSTNARLTSEFVAQMGTAAPPASAAAAALSLGARAAVLFALGAGYGVLVSRLHDEPTFTQSPLKGLVNSRSDWRYLVFCGASGVLLGGLLPLFDGLWEQSAESGGGDKEKQKKPGSSTDWALVMRGVGAFAGIIFAIRRLPWASTMQVSLTLALVNPFLWYLIDRSKPGFLLSAAVGVAGSAALLGLGPEMVPTAAGGDLPDSPHRANGTAPHGRGGGDPSALGGLASQRTVETAIWMLSVLFCSCVCFGNIGRRLALSRSSAARGRWAGVR